ncbi:MAG: hypothetical protein JWM57_785 [Phycisphaerales bacterium]|nr:hypothetical protein [Phycisphaerales bacterium]
MNLSGAQARALIAKGRKGPTGPVPYAWKKNETAKE